MVFELRSFFLLTLILASSFSNSQTNLTIDASNSPFYIVADTTIERGDTLLLSAGAELFMGNHVNVQVKGVLRIKGDPMNRAYVRPINPGIGWGEFKIYIHVDSLLVENAFIEDGRFLSFESVNYFNNVEFVNNQNLVWNAAISRFIRGQLHIENCKIYGSNKGEGFLVHSIENPRVVHSYFNAIPDAIEYLNCNNGRISNCQFFDMIDDAIDLNHCYKTVIDSNLIVNVGNRGMEIGSENNGSSLEIEVFRNVLVNCEEGINFKEGSTGSIRNNTFYRNQKAITIVADGRPNAGSSVGIVNCIFDENQMAIYKDDSSTFSVDYSSSSSHLLIGEENLFAYPRFNDPANLDFTLQSHSKCIDSGQRNGEVDGDGTYLDMGAFYFDQSGLEKYSEKLTLMPNPATSLLTILTQGNFDRIQIVDTKGQLQKNVKFVPSNGGGNSVADVSNLKRGLYVVILIEKNSQLHRKFVKL